MDIPADWLPEAELQAATGVSHRNLLNWRHHGLLPAPIIRRLGVGIGNEAVYPPITAGMVRRIDDLRQQCGDMDDWLWSLWLDGYPVNIVEWCRKRLQKLEKILSGAEDRQLVEAATRKPGKRSDPRRTIYGRLNTKEWYVLMGWAAAVAAHARPVPSLADPASPILAALDKAGNLSASTGNVPLRDLLPDGGAGIENLSLASLAAVLDNVGGDEIEQARRDWIAIRRIAEAGRATGGLSAILSALWKDPKVRAVALPGLMLIRRSPGHGNELAESLAAAGLTP